MPGEEAFSNGIKVNAKADGFPLSFLFAHQAASEVLIASEV